MQSTNNTNNYDALFQYDNELYVHCNNCGGLTWHDVLHRAPFKHYDAPFAVSETHRPTPQYIMVECKGCNHCSFIIRFWDCPDDMKECNPKPYFPDDFQYPRVQNRAAPKWFSDVEPELSRILAECYRALDSKCFTLAAGGARIILDALMTAAIGGHGTFEQKVDRFIADGYLAARSKQIILDTLDAGSAALHRGYRPNQPTLEQIFDIVEHTVAAVDILPSRTSVAHSTPPRPKPPSRKRAKA